MPPADNSRPAELPRDMVRFTSIPVAMNLSGGELQIVARSLESVVAPLVNHGGDVAPRIVRNAFYALTRQGSLPEVVECWGRSEGVHTVWNVLALSGASRLLLVTAELDEINWTHGSSVDVQPSTTPSLIAEVRSLSHLRNLELVAAESVLTESGSILVCTWRATWQHGLSDIVFVDSTVATQALADGLKKSLGLTAE